MKNVIPWRRQDSSLATTSPVDDLWNRLWADGNGGALAQLPDMFQKRLIPAVNIAETEDDFCITMDCPGLKEEDFLVEAMGNQLLISGERKWEEEKQGKEFYRVESQFGRFERSIQLPENAMVDPKQIDASYSKGILKVSIPKREKTPTTKIQVKRK